MMAQESLILQSPHKGGQSIEMGFRLFIECQHFLHKQGSFFPEKMCIRDSWEKEKEITLEEMDDNPEMDSWVMKETQLSELVEDEKQDVYKRQPGRPCGNRCQHVCGPCYYGSHHRT